MKRKQRVCNNCFDTLTKHAIPAEQDDENANRENQGNLNNQLKLSSSDSMLESLNVDGQEEDREDRDALSNFSSVYKKVRRNSSNLTSLSSRSSKCSMFFVDDEQAARERSEDILSSLLEDSKATADKQSFDRQSMNSSHSKVGQFSSTDKSMSVDNPPMTPCTPMPTPQPDFQRNLNLRRSGRKLIPKRLTEISANDRESDMAGYMFERKGKKNWRKYWFVLKSHVLYIFKQSEDVIAIDTKALLGYTVQTSESSLDGQPANLILKITHQNSPDIYLRLETEQCVEKYVFYFSNYYVLHNKLDR